MSPLLAAVGFAAVAALVLFGRRQAKAMRRYFAGRRPELDVMRAQPADLGLSYEPFETTNPEATRLAGWWLPAATATPAGIVLMVHGHGMNKSAMLGRAAVFVADGFHVALLDLRARGESGGDLAEIGPGSAADVLAAARALVGGGRYSGLPMIGYGLSHGARAVLFAAASSEMFAAVVAEAPPFSLRAGLRRITGLPWVPPLPEGNLPRTFRALQQRPILILLGDTDPEISPTQANTLLSGNAHPASQMIVFPRTGHGVFTDENREHYTAAVTAFVRRVVGAVAV